MTEARKRLLGGLNVKLWQMKNDGGEEDHVNEANTGLKPLYVAVTEARKNTLYSCII